MATGWVTHFYSDHSSTRLLLLLLFLRLLRFTQLRNSNVFRIQHDYEMLYALLFTWNGILDPALTTNRFYGHASFCSSFRILPTTEFVSLIPEPFS